MSHPIERACPACGADAGSACIGRRGQQRRSLHRARGRRGRSYPILAAPEKRTESAIEKLLVGAILGWIDHHGAAAAVTTQVCIGRYRADILVEEDGRRLVVECDGAEFHGSPDQVAYDKRRDRFCVSRGIFVMRFSGWEINRDPRRCAAEVGMWITLR